MRVMTRDITSCAMTVWQTEFRIWRSIRGDRSIHW